jgi:hypothetical protein
MQFSRTNLVGEFSKMDVSILRDNRLLLNCKYTISFASTARRSAEGFSVWWSGVDQGTVRAPTRLHRVMEGALFVGHVGGIIVASLCSLCIWELQTSFLAKCSISATYMSGRNIRPFSLHLHIIKSRRGRETNLKPLGNRRSLCSLGRTLRIRKKRMHQVNTIRKTTTVRDNSSGHWSWLCLKS